jgi:hypothetical protein
VDLNGESLFITTAFYRARLEQPFPEHTLKEHRLIARPGHSDRHPLIVLSENFPTEEAMNAALRNGWDGSNQVGEPQLGIIDEMLRMKAVELVP